LNSLGDCFDPKIPYRDRQIRGPFNHCSIKWMDLRNKVSV
jgi:hypothetical protein